MSSKYIKDLSNDNYAEELYNRLVEWQNAYINDKYSDDVDYIQKLYNRRDVNQECKLWFNKETLFMYDNHLATKLSDQFEDYKNRFNNCYKIEGRLYDTLEKYKNEVAPNPFLLSALVYSVDPNDLGKYNLALCDDKFNIDNPGDDNSYICVIQQALNYVTRAFFIKNDEDDYRKINRNIISQLFSFEEKWHGPRLFAWFAYLLLRIFSRPDDFTPRRRLLEDIIYSDTNLENQEKKNRENLIRNLIAFIANCSYLNCESEKLDEKAGNLFHDMVTKNKPLLAYKILQIYNKPPKLYEDLDRTIIIKKGFDSAYSFSGNNPIDSTERNNLYWSLLLCAYIIPNSSETYLETWWNEIQDVVENNNNYKEIWDKIQSCCRLYYLIESVLIHREKNEEFKEKVNWMIDELNKYKEKEVDSKFWARNRICSKENLLVENCITKNIDVIPVINALGNWNLWKHNPESLFLPKIGLYDRPVYGNTGSYIRVTLPNYFKNAINEDKKNFIYIYLNSSLKQRVNMKSCLRDILFKEEIKDALEKKIQIIHIAEYFKGYRFLGEATWINDNNRYKTKSKHYFEKDHVFLYDFDFKTPGAHPRQIYYNIIDMSTGTAGMPMAEPCFENDQDFFEAINPEKGPLNLDDIRKKASGMTGFSMYLNNSFSNDDKKRQHNKIYERNVKYNSNMCCAIKIAIEEKTDLKEFLDAVSCVNPFAYKYHLSEYKRFINTVNKSGSENNRDCTVPEFDHIPITKDKALGEKLSDLWNYLRAPLIKNPTRDLKYLKTLFCVYFNTILRYKYPIELFISICDCYYGKDDVLQMFDDDVDVGDDVDDDDDDDVDVDVDVDVDYRVVGDIKQNIIISANSFSSMNKNPDTDDHVYSLLKICDYEKDGKYITKIMFNGNSIVFDIPRRKR